MAYRCPHQRSGATVSHTRGTCMPAAAPAVVKRGKFQFVRTDQGYMGTSFASIVVGSDLDDSTHVLAPLYRKSHRKSFDDFQPGIITGGVKEGETSVEAVYRELQEELGLICTRTPTFVKTIRTKGCVWDVFSIRLVDLCDVYSRIPKERHMEMIQSTAPDHPKKKVIVMCYGSKITAMKLISRTRKIIRGEPDIIGTVSVRVGKIRHWMRDLKPRYTSRLRTCGQSWR